MRRLHAVLCSSLAFAAAAPVGHAQYELSFTTLGVENTLSGSSGSSLGTITPEDIAIVGPQTGVYSAETLLDHLNLNTLAGDGDGDAFYYEAPLAGRIDALEVCGASADFTARDVFFSTKLPLPCASGGVIEPGDVSGIRIGAGANPMIDDLQIRTALGISPNILSFDVDAVARDPSGALFLSFEQDVPILWGTQMLFDGGIAVIPASALTWADCMVTAVLPDAGFIAANENLINTMVVNASVADNVGNFIQVVFDVDGLELDPNGGTFTSGSGTFPNLIFSGEYLTGGGILSTAAGGSIATINGIPMATAFGWGATDGTQVGLAPGGVGSLDGLALTQPTCRFVMDSSTPFIPTPGPLNLAAGGADPGELVYVYARIYGVDVPGGFQPSVPAANPCFPEWYLWNTYLFSLPADALGIVDVTLPYGGGVPAGNNVVFQALTNKTAGWSLSAPITLQF